MSYICPVCNGLTTLHETCSNCQHHLDDYGRLDNIWGPYSPYREIDHLKMTNGYIDVENHSCIHLASCPVCGRDHIITVKEEIHP